MPNSCLGLTGNFCNCFANLPVIVIDDDGNLGFKVLFVLIPSI
jgi:hypothetical protein